MPSLPKTSLIVAQSGGPTAVVNASLAGVIQAAKAQSRIDRIIGLVNGLEGALRGHFVSLDDQTEQSLALLSRTPAAALGSGRYRVQEADYERFLAFFDSLNARYFVHIGGNGSMAVTHRLAEAARAASYELDVIGVPKTMDNDLVGTDHTPGYGSAARFLALASRDTGRDLELMINFDDVLILETLGRDAGWLAAGAALGKEEEDDAPHLVYIPEIAFDQNRFLDDVARVHGRLGRAFIVVSESLRDAQGDFISRHQSTDPMGRVVHSLSSGVSTYLNDLISEKLRLQTRALRPGLIGRTSSACVSHVDRQEAYQVGQEAVAQLIAGHNERMICLNRLSDQPYVCELGTIPLAQAAAGEKTMPREFMNDAGHMITAAFRDYALPLIDGPLPSLARLQSP